MARHLEQDSKRTAADRLAEEHGLGMCTMMLSARRWSWSRGPAAWRRLPGLPAARTDWVFWYSGGVVQLIANEPGPRIAAWDDLVSVTASFHTTSEDTQLERATVCDRSGTQVTISRGYGTHAPHDVLQHVARVLGPRVLPPLIQKYESGASVIFGDAEISQSGLGHVRAHRETAVTAWQKMRRIDAHVDALMPGLRIGKGRWHPWEWIKLSDRPNGVFVFDMVQHAAAQNGVPFQYMRRARAHGG